MFPFDGVVAVTAIDIAARTATGDMIIAVFTVYRGIAITAIDGIVAGTGINRCLNKTDRQIVVTISCHRVRRIVEEIAGNQVGHIDVLQDYRPVGRKCNMGVVPDLGQDGLQRCK